MQVQLVLTKCDLLSPTLLCQSLHVVELDMHSFLWDSIRRSGNPLMSQFTEESPPPYMRLWKPTALVSASTGAGIHALWTQLKQCAYDATLPAGTETGSGLGPSLHEDGTAELETTAGAIPTSVSVREHHLAGLMRAKHGRQLEMLFDSKRAQLSGPNSKASVNAMNRLASQGRKVLRKAGR